METRPPIWMSIDLLGPPRFIQFEAISLQCFDQFTCGYVPDFASRHEGNSSCNGYSKIFCIAGALP